MTRYGTIHPNVNVWMAIYFAWHFYSAYWHSVPCSDISNCCPVLFQVTLTQNSHSVNKRSNKERNWPNTLDRIKLFWKRLTIKRLFSHLSIYEFIRRPFIIKPPIYDAPYQKLKYFSSRLCAIHWSQVLSLITICFLVDRWYSVYIWDAFQHNTPGGSFVWIKAYKSCTELSIDFIKRWMLYIHNKNGQRILDSVFRFRLSHQSAPTAPVPEIILSYLI